MKRILSLEKEYPLALESATKAMLGGKVFIYPTDTVYGIGGNALDEEVCGRIREIKKRDTKPFSIIVSDFSMLRKYCEVPEDKVRYLFQCLPGPYTFLLRKKEGIPACPGEKIGVRVPMHSFIRKVAGNSGLPIIGTSANISGKAPVFSFKKISRALLKEVDLAIDGGETYYKKESTIVDLVDMEIRRMGAGEFLF
ncbi:MAG: L-threonylcarbamoyladenylate synthase [Candidatus Micrarchaeota archaeon]